MEIHFLLLISPPGGGKTSWLKENADKYDLAIDDASLNPNSMIEVKNFIQQHYLQSSTPARSNPLYPLTNCSRKNHIDKRNALYIAIADPQLCSKEVLISAHKYLKALCEKTLEHAVLQPISVFFSHILFVGDIQTYHERANRRQDGRQVRSSIELCHRDMTQLLLSPLENTSIINININIVG